MKTNKVTSTVSVTWSFQAYKCPTVNAWKKYSLTRASYIISRVQNNCCYTYFGYSHLQFSFQQLVMNDPGMVQLFAEAEGQHRYKLANLTSMYHITFYTQG